MIGAVRKGGVYTISSRLRLADALADHVVYLIRRVTDAGAPAGGGPAPQTAPLRLLLDLAEVEEIEVPENLFRNLAPLGWIAQAAVEAVKARGCGGGG